MTRILIFVLFACVTFSSCKKEDNPVFDQSSDERLNEALTSYQNTLINAPNGWTGYVYPNGVGVNSDEIGGFTFYFKFTNGNRVSMVSDFSDVTSSTVKESSYRLKALQQPALIFDTYNYLHTIADPNPNVSFGWTGKGWATDFEFAFNRVTSDTIDLTGRFNGVKLTLIKAKKEDEDAFRAGRLKTILEASNNYVLSSQVLTLSGANNARAGVSFDYDYLLVKFSFLDAGNNLVIINAPFSHTLTGLHFKFPVTVNGVTFQDMFWDDVKKVYYILSGTNKIEISSSTTPLFTVPLTNSIGEQYTTITVPPNNSLPNQSPLFIQRYNLMKSSLLTGSFGLTLDDLDFIFNKGAKTMTLNVYVYQGTSLVRAQYIYSYSVDASGYFKFTKTSQNTAAGQIQTNMNNILTFIDNDQFKLDGFSTSLSFLGQFTSRQNTAFYFTGFLY